MKRKNVHRCGVFFRGMLKKYFLRDNSHSFRCFLHDMLYHRFYDTLFHCLHTSLTVTLLTLNMMVLVLLTCHENLRDMLYHCWLTCILQAVTLFTLDMTYVSYKLTWHAVTLLFCDKTGKWLIYETGLTYAAYQVTWHTISVNQFTLHERDMLYFRDSLTNVPFLLTQSKLTWHI